MAKLKTIRVVRNTDAAEIVFNYDVYVTKEGMFTTTLPEEVTKKLNTVGLGLERNQSKTPGYFHSNTINGLELEINDIVDEYMSEELVSETIMIKYAIRTTCSYCLENGSPVPNGYFVTDRDNCNWRSGTLSSHAARPEPYGFLVYANPCVKKILRYKTGAERIQYEYLHKDVDDQSTQWLHYLKSFTAMEVPRGEKLQEIAYTEEVAKFFVDLLLSICKINEKIKDLLDPEAIMLLARTQKGILP